MTLAPRGSQTVVCRDGGRLQRGKDAFARRGIDGIAVEPGQHATGFEPQ
jgi:hypothetical protein